MLKDQIPSGILKVDYDLPLLGEIWGGDASTAVLCIADKIVNLQKEMSFVLCLDDIGRPICVGMLGYGSTSGVEMSIREIAQFALLTNARSVILLHNHPGNGRNINELKPSKQDIEIASKVAETLNLFEIDLCDSIIVNSAWLKNYFLVPEIYKEMDEYIRERYTRVPAYYSMRENKKYRIVLDKMNQPPKINLDHPSFSGKDYINTDNNKENELIEVDSTTMSKDNL